MEIRRCFSYSLSIGYYDGSGFGAGAFIIKDGRGLNHYRLLITGSYDFQEAKAFTAGLSQTYHVTKSDLPFYTSLLKNEAFGYFSSLKHWARPFIGFGYGWEASILLKRWKKGSKTLIWRSEVLPASTQLKK